MKIALSVVAVFVLLIALVVCIGALLPKQHVASRSRSFHATPEQLFRLISGPQDWRTDLKDYRSFMEGGRQLRRETSKNGQTLTTELVESRPPWLLKGRIVDNPQFGGSWTFRIDPRNDGCDLTITEEGEVYNPVFRFVSRFVIGHTRTIDNYLGMLASAVDHNRALAKTP